MQLPDGKYMEIPEGMSNNDINGILSSYNEKPGPMSILSDAISKAKESPSELWEGAKQMIPQTADAITQSALNPIRAISNAAIGFNRGGRAALNIAPEIAEYMQSKGIGGDASKWLASKKIPTEMTEGERGFLQSTPETPFGMKGRGDEFIQGGASFLPFAAVPGGAAAKMLSGALYGVGSGQNPFTTASMMALPEVARDLPSAIKNVAEKSTGLGKKLLEQIPKDKLAGQLMNISEGSKPTGTIGKILPKTELPPEQLRLNREAAEGTKTPIGDIIQNPKLKKRFENELATGDSKAMDIMMENRRIIEDRGNEILGSLKGKSSPEELGDVGSILKKSLIEKKNEARAEKNKLYNQVDDLASEKDVKAGVNNYKNYAYDTLVEMESDPRLSSFVPQNVKSILKKAAEEPGESTYSLKKTNLLKSEFGKAAKEAFRAGDERLGGIYNGLKDSVVKDMHEAINNSGDMQLMSKFKNAESNYRTNYLPYKDPAIAKFTDKGADTDLLVQNFLKTSSLSDRNNLLSKLTNKVSPKEKKIIAYNYFSDSIGENGTINPMRWNTKFKKLGDNQRVNLFGKYLPEMERYSRLVDMNTESLNNMLNPKTGSRNMPIAQALGLGIGGVLGKDVFSAYLGKKIAETGVKHARNTESRLHTNESVRNKIVDSLIKSQGQKARMPKEENSFSRRLREIERMEKEE